MATTHDPLPGPTQISPEESSGTAVPVRPTWPSPWQWTLFALQVILVSMVEVGDDILRGNFWRPNAHEAFSNARDVATFEASHGFFVEPALQHFFEQSHHLWGFVLTWSAVTD